MTDSLIDDEIERILDGEDEILPSSGFAASVMEAVHRDVIKLPPLAFPWRRAIPGVVALLAAYGMATWRFIVALNNKTPNVLFDEQLHQLFGVSMRSEIQWVIIAIALTIMSVLLPLRLMRGRI
jgi:hypothetical protein